ncbi:MAG TPA: serine/threonine protein kinase, partial [Candidatus Hydrogenedentes bacterium]|nr:serine/threonine protein kinase [Candidatus Hydrogenedentota bacterium]
MRQTGDRFGDYEIVSELGRGSMGVVYKALDTKLGRHVALKVLTAHLKDHPGLIARFRQEATLSASLNHANIITVFAIGEEGDEFYIAMEYVDGYDLAGLVKKQGKLKASLAVDLTCQAALALHTAHTKGIIHRDIKPANLLVDDDMNVKVADFGLARLSESTLELTVSGGRVGTPRYMAPEQIEGGKASISSDTYALGITLFELLTGRPGFSAENLNAIMHLVVNKPLRKLRDVVPGSSASLERIIMKATSKDPKMRYASALELANALAEWETTEEEDTDDDIAAMPSGDDSQGWSDNSSYLPATEVLPAADTPMYMKEGVQDAGLATETPTPGNIEGIAQLTPPPLPSDGLDFYIHYMPKDEQWADWVYHLLTGVGYEAEKIPWDTTDSHETLRQLLKRNDMGVKTIAIISPTYITTIHGQIEWVNALMTKHWRPFPVMVQKTVSIQSTFHTVNYLDLVRQSQDKGRVLLLEECEVLRGKPRPGAVSTRLKRKKKAQIPKLKDTVWGVPWPTVPHFVGRSQILEQMRQKLDSPSGMVTLVNALPDGIGVGLSQLAVEYVNLNKTNYSVIWWVRGSSRVSIQTDLSSLVEKLDLPEKTTSKLNIRILALKKWLSLNTSWLLVFEDTKTWRILSEYLPKDIAGHVITISPRNRWPEETNPLGIGPLNRDEAINLLFSVSKIRSEGAAAALASSLGDTPLALTLAAQYMVQTKCNYDQYYDLFVNEHRKIWGISDPAIQPASVIRTALIVTMKRIHDDVPGVLDMLKVLAYLGDGPFTVSMLVSGAKTFPRTLRKSLQDPRKFDEMFSRLKRYGLIVMEDERVTVPPGIKKALLYWLALDTKDEASMPHQEATTLLRPNRWEQKFTVSWSTIMGKFYEDLLPDPENVQDIQESSWLVPHIADYLRAVRESPVDSMMISGLWLYVSTHMWMIADYLRASSACRHAIEERVKATGSTHKKVAELYLHSGNIFRAQGDNQKAREEYQHAFEIHESARGKNFEEMADILQQIGNICMDMEDFASARQAYRKALDLNVKHRGTENEAVCRDYTNLGLVAQELQDYTEAWENYQTGLEIADKILEENNPMKAYVVKNMA